MKNLRGRKLADSVSSVGSMILFLLYASCSLIIIAAGASAYSRIDQSFTGTFNASTAVRYVTNKIRGGDSAVIEKDGKGIAVYSGDSVCVIMTDNGGIAERTARTEAYVDFVGGDMIFSDSSLYISEDSEGMYTITVSSGSKSYTAYCRSKG